VDVHVSLDGRRDITGQVYAQLREAIVGGALRPGDRLPATRELAERLAVSRTTVTVAYDRLMGEGFLVAQIGAGTFVSDDVGVAAPAEGAPEGALRPRPVWSTVRMPFLPSPGVKYDFRCGLPDVGRFPFDVWRRLLGRHMNLTEVGRVMYGEPAGHPALRAAIARHLGVSRAVRASADDIIVTNGIQQALDLVARVLVAPGERVAVEDPGYPPARSLLDTLGLDVASVPVDAEGIVVDAIPAETRAVLVTPSHQFPLGHTMSLRRRVALLRWAEAHDAAIIEDDYDSEFRFAGRPIEPLQNLDTSGRVLYTGSFSKTLLPSLRLGFVVVPASLRPAMHAAKYVTDWSSSTPQQLALAELIDRGWFARHLRAMRTLYRERHRMISTLLDEQFSGVLRVVPSGAGLHLSAVAEGMSAEECTAVVHGAAARGVAAYSLGAFGLLEPQVGGVVIGYGAIQRDDIPAGLEELRAAFAA
jgi:GntR family transcriptional regulator / MocR family aminotransferase